MPVSVLTLKAAIRRLIKDCGGQESCVLVEGIGNARHQYFSEAGNPALPERLLRLDQVALLEADCGEAHVTRELARASGHLLVPMPRAMAADVPHRALISIAKEHSELMSRGLEACSDGRITAAERAELRANCRRVLEAVAQLDENLRVHGGEE